VEQQVRLGLVGLQSVETVKTPGLAVLVQPIPEAVAVALGVAVAVQVVRA
jgi:hypothetical protein